MKNLRILLFLSLAFILVVSCKKEAGVEYYSTLGVISIKTDSIIIDSDEGNRLLVTNTNLTGFKDKDRVVANFTLVDKTLPVGIDYIIDIYTIEKVLFKPIIVLTDNIEDSIGNDELFVNSLWLIKDFLNLNFSYYGGNVPGTKHYINLIRHEGMIPTDTIDLEIRHNKNNDGGSYAYQAFVSFDLTSLKNEVADSVVLRVKAKENNDRTLEKYLTYKY